MLENYLLTLSVAQLRVINDALMNSPYGLVFPIINSINSQIERINSEEMAKQAVKTAPVTEPVSTEPSPTVITTPEAIV